MRDLDLEGSISEDLVQGHLRADRVHFYVYPRQATESLAGELTMVLGARGNVVFLPLDDTAILYGRDVLWDERVGEVAVVSELQLFPDLYNYIDRAREAAELLVSPTRGMRQREEELVDKILQDPSLLGENVSRAIRAEGRTAPDIVAYDRDGTLLVVECKSGLASLASVSQLDRYVEEMEKQTEARHVRGVLCAPRITKSAMEKVEKSGHGFRRLEP